MTQPCISNITFVIFTYNEEKRIERVIKNFLNFGKVLLADNNSTDRTQEIAKSYGCDIFLRKEDYVFVEDQRLVNQLYDVITTDWIYWGFADEMLEKQTLLKILEITNKNEHDIISIERKNYTYGTFIGELFHGYSNKVFKKHAIDFSKNVIHGMGTPTVLKERIYQMPSTLFVHHFGSYTASSYLNTIQRYTEVEKKSSVHYNRSMFGIIKLFSKRVLKNYIYDGGYKSGYAGLASVILSLCYEIVKDLKIYEYSNGLDTCIIEEKNDEIRDSILKAFKD